MSRIRVVVINRLEDQQETIRQTLEEASKHIPVADGYFNVSSCSCGEKFSSYTDWQKHILSLVISGDEVDAETQPEEL